MLCLGGDDEIIPLFCDIWNELIKENDHPVAHNRESDQVARAKMSYLLLSDSSSGFVAISTVGLRTVIHAQKPNAICKDIGSRPPLPSKKIKKS